jgi:F-type H+-transporting ATPase subunit delta
MPETNDRALAVARVYSHSILGLAAAGGEAESLLEELQELVRYLGQQPAFADFLSSPLVAVGDREKALEKLFRGRASDLLVNALQVLNRKGRLGLLPTITEVYRRQHKELRGQIDVHVRTAITLTPDLRGKLQAAVSRFTGHEAQLIETVDERMLGGMVLQIGDQKIDASVKRELEEMRELLEERAALEIHRLRQEQSVEA